MEVFHRKLEQAKREPRLVVAEGDRGVPILSIEATCLSCGWVAGLVAWPCSSGMTFVMCGAGCRGAEVFSALNRLTK